MKYQPTRPFLADYDRLSEREKAQFLLAVQDLNRAYAQRGQARLPRWPAHLRVKDVEGVSGVWELTWAWPDGRATFEYVEVEGEVAIRWRRVDGHDILRRP